MSPLRAVILWINRKPLAMNRTSSVTSESGTLRRYVIIVADLAKAE